LSGVERARGIPGLRGGEHIGLTVPDLDAAVRFFVDVIGCDFVFDGGTLKDAPDFMRDQLSVPPEASLRYSFLRCRTGLNLEVFEYTAPDQARTPPRNSDVGGHHIAFYVEDIDAAVAYLKERGVEVQGEVDRIACGPAAGSAWVYFRTPWGLQLELVSYPNGKAYEADAETLLWSPLRPER